MSALRKVKNPVKPFKYEKLPTKKTTLNPIPEDKDTGKLPPLTHTGEPGHKHYTKTLEQRPLTYTKTKTTLPPSKGKATKTRGTIPKKP